MWDYKKSYHEAVEKIPFLEFIWGDVATGWVWTEMLQDYPNLKIGDKISLPMKDGIREDFQITTFNRIYVTKEFVTTNISFNVEKIS